jgi:putative membrane protein
MNTKKIIRGVALSGVIAGVSWIGAAAQSTSSAAGSQNSASSASSSQSGKLAASDRQFMIKAAQGGKAEVELGQLAQQNASSPEVKQFGQRMVTDHTQASEQLKQIASQKGVTLPESLNAKDAATKARLEKLNGQAFDRAYMKDMVMDHTKDVSEFKTEAKTGKDPDVKNFASQTAPTLEEHLKQAKSIAPKGSSETASK